MSDSLRDLVLAHIPEDGSSIGNSALIARLREIVPNLSDEDYAAAKDALVDEGILGKGKGRGGSVYLITEDDEDEDQDDDFELTPTEEPAPKAKRAAAKAKAAPRKSGEPAQVISYRHTDTRVNNPEVGMVHPDNDPDQPKTVWAYDPHLDPALMFDSQRARVEKLIDDALASDDPATMKDALAELRALQAPYLNWAGKAERTSFQVDTVSLHVHERVDPATILANARKRLKGEAKAAEVWRQADLFAAPFENLPLRQALDFYHHEKGWSNRLIAGDSLLVMNSLLQKEAMAGRVQMIYIDPPYGIKYGSNFQPFTNKRDVKDGADDDLTQEPEMIKAFRDTWELGIHSYLTYLRDRLWLAKELLHEGGSVFVQISDENLHHVRELLDEVFGPSNLVSVITFKKTTGAGSPTGGTNVLAATNDYIIWYAKDLSRVKYRQLYLSRGGEGWVNYNYIRAINGEFRRMNKDEASDWSALPKEAEVYRRDNLTSTSSAGEAANPFVFQGVSYSPHPGGWKTSANPGLQRLLRSERMEAYGKTLAYRRFATDFPWFKITNLWDDTVTGGFAEDRHYVVQTGAKVVERCMLMTTDPGDLVLDPTCGSGTTAFVAEKWGRRWITCDTSRVAITLAKQRLMTASFDYFRLAYPHEGLKGGFVYQTAPHIMLQSIANNPDIDTIYMAKHPAIATALAALNDTLSTAPPFRPSIGARKGKPVTFTKGERLEEWEVPFDLPGDWPAAAAEPFAAFHTARQAMQAAMDASIKAHADQETLYDKPELDKSRLRITGPFSVEAVPAPSVLSLDDVTAPTQADATVARSGETSRQTQWRDELVRTGLRAKGGAMLKITDLQVAPGLSHIHAVGSVAETGETIAVSFGPEHAALEQKQVERAIEDAQKLVPKPKFVVFCAFTFDPEAAKDIDEMQWPGVTLLKAQMNTDLLTEDLKKAKSSNQSFWLMGQPEVECRKRADGMFEVEVLGFDYFDPRTGELSSGGTKNIAMWSLDTDYDGRSLMPHQVFFPMAGAKDGWNRLKKTIRAELDEDLLEQFHGTVSLPFEAGDQRRVAVKIVDDRGIESLKIIALGA